ncbi:MAG: flagellar protein FliT [Pseudobdellovibrionaceae bacterium]
MVRIIDLLNHKNHYLEKFYSLNENELLNFAQNDFTNLESFYQAREKILETIRYIDSEIDQVQETQLNDAQKREVATSLAIKEEYVGRILAQDLEILSCIESAKSSIIRELQEIRKTRKAVGSYKSRQFNNRLDEEA